MLPEALAAADERELDARARAKRDAKITRAARAQLLAGYNKLTGGRHMVRAYSKKLQAAREREVRRSLGGGLPARFVCLSAAAGLRGPARSDQVRRAQKARRAPGTRTRAPLTIITLMTLSRSEAFRAMGAPARAEKRRAAVAAAGEWGSDMEDRLFGSKRSPSAASSASSALSDSSDSDSSSSGPASAGVATSRPERPQRAKKVSGP